MNGRRWLLLGLLTVAVFGGLLAYGDFRQVGRTLFESPAAYTGFAAGAGLAVVNYALRYLRWSMYLRALGINAPASVSAPVFVAGLALSITPGKVGELLKSVWLHQRTGTPVAASAPAVVMERLTDVISVALLGLTGALLLPTPIALTVVGLLMVGLATTVEAIGSAIDSSDGHTRTHCRRIAAHSVARSNSRSALPRPRASCCPGSAPSPTARPGSRGFRAWSRRSSVP